MKRAFLTKSFVLLAAASLPLVIGCSDNGLRLAKVSGKVTYKGQPVKNGTVFFMPDDSKGTVGPPAVGSIGTDGSYVMSTESSGDGVIIGSHKVGITGVDEKPESDEAAPDPESDPTGYLKSKAKSAAEAGSGRKSKEDDLFTDRGGKKWRYVLPKKFSSPEESGIFVKIDGSKTVNFDIDDSGNVRVTP